MKYSKILLSATLAIGAVSLAVIFLRAEDPAATTVKPQAWIADTAVALNRASIVESPHGMAREPAAMRDTALQAAHVGEQLRVQRKFAECAQAFREAVKADPTDADSWADLADCEAAAAGNDLSAGRESILHALRIDPRHPKALWLRASLELQEQRYAAAAGTWRELQTILPPDSSDAKIIAANIAEADALSRAAGPETGQGT